jgi:hypothetical protein
LTLGKGSETAADNSGKVNENVFTAVAGCNETETLGFVEPLDSTCDHVNYLLLNQSDVFDCSSSRAIYRIYLDGISEIT